MTLHVVPIEPMMERYSAQWLTWFDQVLGQVIGLQYRLREYEPVRFLETGQLSKIEQGEFLDILGTNLYKTEQLHLLLTAFKKKDIVDGDSILFLDGWFPGVEMLAYVRDGLKRDVKFIGMFHAGTYDKNDFLTQCGMETWASHLEKSWFSIYDKIVVATKYHQNLLIEHRDVPSHKIKVIFFPMLTDWLIPELIEREPLSGSVSALPTIVVFPHRLAPEKQPEFFDVFEHRVLIPGMQFVRTKDTCGTKQAYWELLARSDFAVSFAKQETFGIAMIESVLCNCVPIVPDRCSYSELYPDCFKYEVIGDEVLNARNKLKELTAEYDRQSVIEELRKLQRKFIVLGQLAIPTIVQTCLS